MATTLYDTMRMTSLHRQPSTGEYSNSRTGRVGVTFKGDKTRGVWVTFQDGSKFRRATDHSVFRFKLQPGPGQNTQGIAVKGLKPGYQSYVRTTPGGYCFDDIASSSMANGFKAGGLTSLLEKPGFPTGMRNEVSTKALLEIANGKANIGENLATLRQTVGLASIPIGKLVKEILEVKRNKSFAPLLTKSAKDIYRGNFNKLIAQEYLKYVYGWKPLMQDIFGVMELAKAAGKQPLLIHGSSKATQSEQTDEGEFHNSSRNGVTRVPPMTAETTMKCSIWARMDPDYQGTRALNQLGLLNPASLAWELVPFSFVVDWVLPIGPVLQALTAPAGLIFVDGSLSSRVTATGTWANRLKTLDTGGYAISADTNGSGTITYSGYTRSRLSTWPKVGLWLDYNPFRGDRSLKALALTILSLKGLSRR